jgi:hypothetical protein
VYSLLAEGANEKALDVAKLAVTQFPQQFQTHICLARAYIAIKDFVKALETLNAIPIPDISNVAPKDTYTGFLNPLLFFQKSLHTWGVNTQKIFITLLLMSKYWNGQF